jgi:hypothetical protein
MRERPILFSAPMVLALLAGTKTQTRRLVKVDTAAEVFEPYENWDGETWGSNAVDGTTSVIHCPYGKPGDRLWVKETWRPLDTLREARANHGHMCVRYAADSGGITHDASLIPSGWKRPKAAKTGNVSPLFMPRWASRITLEVTGVRVERLQSISRDDAIAEGCEMPTQARGMHPWPEEQYATLWESINGDGSWAANPWVWVVEFARVTP